ncbi:peptidase domain-containing ABC transporter [Xanthomonas campestris pv. campestris]|jgi:ATP-binding cassette subfamily B protein RaxB|uniref:peptidase domain-containing ABC transporter n=1 Tax=Xanthomonas TaxID=338 RepID=UPI0005DCA5BC|nr:MULTISPECIES: peptidase domain-containing ABC transporter [Xanthomonas]MDM7727876.1 peptidase domain-containing ABC transporter [Xanthomonas campestris pv. campestris]UQQ13568.1 peptidase domain-containing ABC transporter [Xanthomonas arboricola pv. corylina]WDJ88919.1 peptidase domain-containing ABC transporter [Xanthomonas campestris]WDK51168.1 peptidase domain-containing ABC transporter [Xanthomonas campestris pv. campestris]WDK52586.1 peptidase domain-containing ABC transporter [Xanthom
MRDVLTPSANGDAETDRSAEPSLVFSSKRRVPHIRQTESSECGLACIAMLLSYYGHETSLGELRNRFTVSTSGATLASLIEIADANGLTTRPLRLELYELPKLSLPCMVHLHHGHFVVLTAVRGGHVHISDPATGVKKIKLDEFDELFSGIALEAHPGPAFKKIKSVPSVSLRDLAGSLRSLVPAFWGVGILALFLEGCALIAPQYLRLTMDQVLSVKDDGLVTTLAIGFSIVLLVQLVLTVARKWTLLWISSTTGLRWSSNLFRHLVSLPQSYFVKRHTGDISSRFQSIYSIQQSLTTKMMEAVIDGVMSFLMLLLLMSYDAPLAFALLAFTIAYVGSRYAYYAKLKEANLDQINIDARRQSLLYETVRSIQPIKLFNKSALWASRFTNYSAKATNATIGAERIRIGFDSVQLLIQGLCRIFVIWEGTRLVLSGDMTIGVLTVFLIYATQFSQRSINLADYLMQLRLLRLHTERISDITHSEPESFLHGNGALEDAAPAIAIANGYFRYSSTDKWIMSALQLRAPAGQVIAIVGNSGVGKTTLIRVLAGLEDLQVGDFLVNGEDLRKVGKSSYRSKVSIVMQGDNLLSGTLSENISMFDEHIDQERLVQAAKLACIHDDIQRMPMGFNTRVGDLGNTLSGGQKQRIFLARAFYRRTKLLLMDEPTTGVDEQMGIQLMKNIKSIGATTVVVTHDKNISRMCDMHYLFVNGNLRPLIKEQPSSFEQDNAVETAGKSSQG